MRGGGIRVAERTREWRIAIVNLAGCVLFGLSTIASYVVPATGDVLALAAANVATSLGALCFLIGAVMLLPDSRDAERLGPDDEPAVGAAAT